ncbi:MAG TPA: hypothetical protein VFM02_02700 [Candidatus Paceibacterota bacterium]|nr:hypothetical protein [Candidatus Paceibacterota bacterium]
MHPDLEAGWKALIGGIKLNYWQNTGKRGRILCVTNGRVQEDGCLTVFVSILNDALKSLIPELRDAIIEHSDPTLPTEEGRTNIHRNIPPGKWCRILK